MASSTPASTPASMGDASNPSRPILAAIGPGDTPLQPLSTLSVHDTPAPQSSGAIRATAVGGAKPSEQAGPPLLMSPPDCKDPNLSATPADIRDLSDSLHGANLQGLRMSIFGFEPYSLPPSRINSNDDNSGSASQTSPNTLAQPPSLSRTQTADMQSPPLTPAETDPATSSDNASAHVPERLQISANNVISITPQASSSQGAPSPLGVPPEGLTYPPRANHFESLSSEPAPPPPEELDRPLPAHRRDMFSVGPRSTPASRDSSPSRPASQFFTRPLTPSGDTNDPYSSTKRQPQDSKNIDPRFVFSRKQNWSPSSSYTNLAKSARNQYDQSDKRKSALATVPLGGKSSDLVPLDSAAPTVHGRQGSMADLKRFIKAPFASAGKKTSSSPANSIRGKKGSPASSIKSRAGGGGSRPIPFGDDHGLSNKWGRLGKVLGSGAGGSVRLMKRSEDGTVFAVKEFRPRHSYESEKDYVKKLTAEFCIGSTLHHGNVIETLDIVSEKGKWYEVMEYAPYDLFAIVMTGKMTRSEVTCCWLQILSGLTYLHGMGLAHRDLKLDNVVVSANGIMKIIDFGSAHVFQYSFESVRVPAAGIVGSDPYLAPEVYDENKYDAAAVDIWSLAIIFCCMSLRRFPWKLPRTTDNSYRLYMATPTPGHEPEVMVRPHRVSNEAGRTAHSAESGNGSDARAPTTGLSHAPTATNDLGEPKKEVIRGAWRLLRLLPRESRHVIYRMLWTDPTKRATMAEILDDPWVSQAVICQETEPNRVTRAENHTHILEPPAAPPKA